LQFSVFKREIGVHLKQVSAIKNVLGHITYELAITDINHRLKGAEMSIREKILITLIDKWCLQIDAFTWYRHRLLSKFMIRSPIKVLNVGTGGGIETLKLLRLHNNVVIVESDGETALRTLNRIKRNGFLSKYNLLLGHISTVEIKDKFDEIYMCEVLEHITDDVTALRRISNLLLPGGRLILSTPTASYGQLSGDAVSLVECGGHVRVGYDGPELDCILEKVGLFTLRRIYIGNFLVRGIINMERWISPRFGKLGFIFSLAMRPLVPILDIFPYRPFDQITIAIKRYW
jgi:2-polyprenyl-3-methyl-5-hydroxy-6-metoxy-1,4-benzoquinol methylase